MKFDELVFEPHSVAKDMGDSPFASDWKDHTQCRWYHNDIEVSIIFGKMFYSNGVDTYELMVLSGLPDDESGVGEPLGYLTKGEVEKFLNNIIDNG